MGNKGVIVDNHKVSDIFDISFRYNTEKKFCDIIEENIESIICLFEDDVKIISLEREWHLYAHIRGRYKKGKPNLRADFKIETENNKYLIEAKNPKHKYSELRNAVSQCMDYKLRYPDYVVILLTSTYDNIVTRMILEYNLDIKYVLSSNDNIALMKGRL